MEYIQLNALNELFVPLIAALAVFYVIYSLMNRFDSKEKLFFWKQNKPSNSLSNPAQSFLPKPAFRSQYFSFKKNLTSRKLVNNSEMRFFHILSQAMPECHVFPQVSFNALVTQAQWISQLRWQRSVRRSFNTKYVDFVLCRKSDFGVVAVVEYDGSGHDHYSDNRRDEMLRSVGYRIERFTGQDSLETVKCRFEKPQETGHFMGLNVVSPDFTKGPWSKQPV